ADVQNKIAPLQARENQFKTAHNQLKKAQTDLAQITAWMEDRYQWVDLVKEIRRVLINVENLHKRKLGVETGLWIEDLRGISTVPFDPNAIPGAAPTTGFTPEMSPELRARYGEGRALPPRNAEEAAAPQPPAPTPTGEASMTPTGGINTNDEHVVTVLFRGVSLDAISGNATADKDMAFAVQTELKASPHFDPAKTELLGDIVKEDLTFKFGMALGLKTRAKDGKDAKPAAPTQNPGGNP